MLNSIIKLCQFVVAIGNVESMGEQPANEAYMNAIVPICKCLFIWKHFVEFNNQSCELIIGNENAESMGEQPSNEEDDTNAEVPVGKSLFQLKSFMNI